MAPLASCPLNKVQVEKAVAALLKYVETKQSAKKAQLIEQQEHVTINFGLHTIPETKRVKPYMM
jgi:hypothetical protein